ncbi:unnamed protein product [Owenia fusiformis]|uniref:Uncharacterized protein n=1 Tax=Owenia fusiformis TaxID=6347 RepID=A0A8S4NLN1_OWEFU|nr:unnamed protein product [Owenia fusiformis]
MAIWEVLLGSFIFATYLADTVAVPTVLPVNSYRDSRDTAPVNCYGTLLAETALLVPASCVYDRKNRKPHRTIKVNNVAIGNTKSVVHVSSTWLKKGHPSYNIALVIIPTQQSTPTTKLTWSPYSIEQIEVKLKSSTKAYAGCASLKKLGPALDEMGDRMIPFKCTNLATPEKQGAPVFQTNNGIDEVFGLYNGACTIGWGLKSKKGHCGVRLTKTTFDEICAVAIAKSLTVKGCKDMLLTKGTGDPEPTVIRTYQGYTAVVSIPIASRGLFLKFCPADGCCGAKSTLFGQMQTIPSLINETVVRQINMVNFSLNVDATPAMLYRPQGKDFYLEYKGRLTDFMKWKAETTKDINAGRIRRGSDVERPGKRRKVPTLTDTRNAETCPIAVNRFSNVPSYCLYGFHKDSYTRSDLSIKDLENECKEKCTKDDVDTGRCLVTVTDGAFEEDEPKAESIDQQADECSEYMKEYNICNSKDISDCEIVGVKRERSKRLIETPSWNNCKQFFLGEKPPNFPTGSSSNHKKICQDLNEKNPTKFYYATLYDTSRKIPHWSAYKVTKVCPPGYSPRPSYWRKDNGLGCSDQANDAHYTNKNKGKNDKQWDRGHLNPNAINNCDYKEQAATFTLTNAAPQVHKFNGASRWAKYERYTRDYFVDKCKGGHLYLITGTIGDSTEKPLKNFVRIPRYFWTAGCCVKASFSNNAADFIGSFAYYGENTETSVIKNLQVSALETFLGKGVKLFLGYPSCGTSTNTPKSDLEKYLTDKKKKL